MGRHMAEILDQKKNEKDTDPIDQLDNFQVAPVILLNSCLKTG